MSAFGTKRTFAPPRKMSALGGKADMLAHAQRSAFDPKRTCRPTHSDSLFRETFDEIDGRCSNHTCSTEPDRRIWVDGAESFI